MSSYSTRIFSTIPAIVTRGGYRILERVLGNCYILIRGAFTHFFVVVAGNNLYSGKIIST